MKKGCVEPVFRINDAPGPDVTGFGQQLHRYSRFFQFAAGEKRDGFDSILQVFPELLNIIGPGKPPGHPDNGYFQR